MDETAALKVSVLSDWVFHVVQVANGVPLVTIPWSPEGRVQFVVSELETEKPDSPDGEPFADPSTDPSATFWIEKSMELDPVRRRPSESIEPTYPLAALVVTLTRILSLFVPLVGVIEP